VNGIARQVSVRSQSAGRVGHIPEEANGRA
jgi:hypothetical protein